MKIVSFKRKKHQSPNALYLLREQCAGRFLVDDLN